MVDRDALVRFFKEYARALLEPYDVGTALYRLSDNVVSVLGVDGAGVSLAHDGQRLTFVAGTDATVAAVERQQIEHGEGPCHEAFQTGDPVAANDLAADTRWPHYRPAAVALGVGAVAGLPMEVGDRRLGALNLYRQQPHEWTDEEFEVGLLLAEVASGYIVNATELESSRNLTEQLQNALDSRTVIEQAKGVLVERHRIDIDEAFQRMRTHARSTNTRIHDLARRVIAGEADV